MFKNFFKKFIDKPNDKPCKAKLPAKDPKDGKLTESSKVWETTRSPHDGVCPHCFQPLSEKEWWANICNDCGESFMFCSKVRWREIWNGEEWIYQIRYSGQINHLIKKDKITFIHGMPAYKIPQDAPKV